MTSPATIQKTSPVRPAPAPSRMSLANVSKGKLEVPIKCIGYGPDGAGKSTWASGAPKPIWLPLDNRTAHLDIQRLPQPTTWDEALEGLRLLEVEKHDYETVVVDPVNWLEPMLAAKLTGDPLVDLANWKSYSKGFEAAVPHWRVLVLQLERLWLRGMNVLLLAHCKVQNFADPEGPAYDRYELSLDKKAAGLLKQWCDYVLLMKHEAVGKVDATTKRARGQETGRRLIYTTWTAAYDAKFSGSVPPTLELSWPAFLDAARAGKRRLAELHAQLRELVAELGAEPQQKALELIAGARDDANRLEEILNAVLLKLDEQKAAAVAAKGQGT